jgi:hypothetical protein
MVVNICRTFCFSMLIYGKHLFARGRRKAVSNWSGYLRQGKRASSGLVSSLKLNNLIAVVADLIGSWNFD